MSKDVGNQICFDCGPKYGKRKTDISSVWEGHCDYCQEWTGVTEVRDFGYPFLPEKEI